MNAKHIINRRLTRNPNMWLMNEENKSVDPKFISEGLPFVVTLKNKTNEKLRLVDVINYSFLSEKNIEYSFLGSQSKYEDFLKFLSSTPEKDNLVVGLTHIQSSTSNQPFQTFYVVQNSPTGSFLAQPITPILDPNQQQSGVVIVQNEYSLNRGLDIIITELFPDASVTFRLYLKLPEKKLTRWEKFLKRFKKKYRYIKVPV